jgi:predicted PurR-regulated permease PerM
MGTAMNSTPKSIPLIYVKIALGLLAFLVFDRLVGFLFNGRDLFVPFVLAVFLTFLLNPLIAFFEKRRIPQILSILLALGVTIVFILVIAQVTFESISAFSENFSKYEDRLNELGGEIVGLLGISPDVLSGKLKLSEDPRAAQLLKGLSISNLLSSVLKSVNNVISKLVLVFLFLLFLLLGRNQFLRKVGRAFPASVSEKATTIFQNINEQVQKYLMIKTLISLLTSGLVMIILFLFGVDFVLVWGLLAFLFNFIPNIGSFIASLLPLALAFIQFDNYFKILWLAILLFGVQFICGNLLEPKFMGKSINLSPVVILFALIFWGFLWGIMGMFLSVPIMAIIKIIFENVESLRPVGILMSGEVKGDV